MYSASFLIVVHLCVAMAITGKVYAFFLKPITYIGNFFSINERTDRHRIHGVLLSPAPAP